MSLYFTSAMAERHFGGQRHEQNEQRRQQNHEQREDRRERRENNEERREMQGVMQNNRMQVNRGYRR